ncbi:MAG TPA: anti-sigma factor [Planosporangium sp.]|jgi:hypothetical protein|nr:anti-sigma factor [Planosporangium sp.]
MARDSGAGDIHALAGAYALDAIDDIERATFARHAAGCEVCALDLTELRETVGRMAEANWSVPPPRMRAAVLAEVARTRQVTGRGHDDGRMGHLAAAARWRRRTAMAVAAGILAVGGGVATWSVTQQRTRDEHGRTVAEQERSRRVSEVLSAPDARLSRDGQVTVVASPSRDTAVVILGDLPDLGPAQAYQLWAIRGKQLSSVGLLRPGQRTGTVLVANMTGAEGLGVSHEPARGSQQPTPDAIVQIVKLA